MRLPNFIQSLLLEGKVVVEGAFPIIEEAEEKEVIGMLQSYYKEDRLEAPLDAPTFSAASALWGAKYIYRATYLTVNREATEQDVKEQLSGFDQPITPEVIYSADLLLRYLPTLFELAKGLAPSDILVKELYKTASEWPFSSVGILLENPVDENVIFSHPSLRIMYTDRVIKKRDKSRINQSQVLESIYETAGNYLSILWLNFEKPL